jgi:hypothetical protein
LAYHAVAEKNMFSEAASELVSQLVISASNAAAPKNMSVMLWT